MGAAKDSREGIPFFVCASQSFIQFPKRGLEEIREH